MYSLSLLKNDLMTYSMSPSYCDSCMSSMARQRDEYYIMILLVYVESSYMRMDLA